jgi:hypothetical protein
MLKFMYMLVVVVRGGAGGVVVGVCGEDKCEKKALRG